MMWKFFSSCFRATPLFLALILIFQGINTKQAKANETVSNLDSMLDEISNYSETKSAAQVTSVSQLRDVSPTDWAYEALRSLVERYGCIVGYPDRTYRGNRALSRYEFAAGLNACMQQMERLIASSEAVLREDIDTLKRLMQEFESELAALGARVDNLEGRVAFLEDHQFSTTTKLKGEVIMSVQAYDAPDYKLDQYYSLGGRSPIPDDVIDALSIFSSEVLPGNSSDISDIRSALNSFNSGDISRADFDKIVADEFGDPDNISDIDESDIQATLSNRVRLTLNTSFTGKDLLRTRLAAGNVPDLGDAFGTDQARLNFQQSTGNDVRIDRLYYRTPFADKGTFWVGTSLPPEDIYETFSPFTESSGSGSLARGNRYNPFIYRTTAGGGIGAKYKFNDMFDITATYLAGDAESPLRGEGLFNGRYSAGAQIGVHPTENWDLGFSYMYNYFPGSVNGATARANLTGSLGSDYSSGVSRAISLLSADGRGGFRGARDPFSGAATTSNNVGIQSTLRISENINWAAWGGWSSATAESADSTGVDRKGDWAELWTWSTNFSFIDLGKEGAVLTFAGGQLPSARYVEGTFGRDRSQSWIVEGNYKFPVTKNIVVTPGVYAVFNPNNSDGPNNDTIVVGVLRSVFKF